MIRALSLLCLMLAVLFAAPVSRAEDGPIGKIIAVEGQDALVTRATAPETQVAALTDDVVFLNDVLQTGPDGRMVVMLLDDTQFTLGENASIKIDEYAYDDQDNEKNMARYSVLRGAFLYVSGLMTQKEKPDVRIKTAYGSIGVRGTIVWGGSLEDQYNVFVKEGEITFETNRGRIRVNATEGTTIRSTNAIPERAKIWGQPKIDAAVSTIALRNVPDIENRANAFRESRSDMMARHRDKVRAGRLVAPVIPRAESTKEIRPVHQKPEPKTGQESKSPQPQPGTEAPADVKSEEKAQEPAPAPEPEVKNTEPVKQDDAAAPGPEPVPEAAQPVPANPVPAPVKPAEKSDAAPPAAPLAAPASEEKKATAEMPFPKQESTGDSGFGDNLPADPAKRQEEMERQMLEKKAPERRKKPDPL